MILNAFPGISEELKSIFFGGTYPELPYVAHAYISPFSPSTSTRKSGLKNIQPDFVTLSFPLEEEQEVWLKVKT